MTTTTTTSLTLDDLPGLNCGLCGSASCAEMIERLAENPDVAKRCIYLEPAALAAAQAPAGAVVAPAVAVAAPVAAPSCTGCAVAPSTRTTIGATDAVLSSGQDNWSDTLGREYDFVLEHFPEDPGPREIILPHNPLLTRELDIQVGDVLIGRPLGMSCGCPITHCGVTMQVDHRTGVIVWCVTGPLRPRQEGYKDLGYYIAEGYEGLINRTRKEIKIGLRYFFQPQRCMLQWRHSGLVNYMSRTATGLQVRVEGLWIG
ncbi:MAG: (Fe-S)-binding protein [Solirubrobacteraceae bacterium]